MGRTRTDHIDKVFEYGFNIPTRTIYLFDDIDETAAYKVKVALDLLEGNSQNEITIVLDSLGGCFYNGMGIYDAITGCKSHITIKGYGCIFSMASCIMQAGDTRVMMPNATMMLHYGHTELDGHSQSIMAAGREEERLNTMLEDIYLERIRTAKPKFPRKRLRDLLMPDFWLTANQALELNLVDKVG